jgi:DNA-binding GntR family transcriptional regulator
VLSENELAATLGTSRTPIREALVLLVREGLVQVFPKIGSFVSRVDPYRVADAQFLREAVELASIRSLHKTGPLDQGQMDALRDNVKTQAELAEDQQEQFFALDDQFHRGLLNLGGHAGSWDAVAQAKAHLDRARMLGLREAHSIRDLAAEHQAILEAVAGEKLGEAEDLLRAHLRAVFGDIEAIREAHPDLFAADPDAVPVRRSIAVWP